MDIWINIKQRICRDILLPTVGEIERHKTHMKRHTNIIITAVASLLIVTLAGREFIKNHKKESNDKSSTNVSENTCEAQKTTSNTPLGLLFILNLILCESISHNHSKALATYFFC